MMFCDKCGSILKPKTEKGKKVLYCSNCNITQKDVENATIKETVKKKEPEIEVVPEDDDTLPTTDAECSKCKNDLAYYWLVQTRAGDEPETKFLKCTKCKHIWRDYS
ncbi:transcription factor S [Candidatus Woesearchaeota archaeon]|nr:transcription factor S [Candidatus Woesearchaeota archaeon]